MSEAIMEAVTAVYDEVEVDADEEKYNSKNPSFSFCRIHKKE